jgi:hypothetical protein
MNMNNIYKSNKNDKATLCVKNTCATVYGDAAKIVTGIVVFTVAIAAISTIAKAIK